jgi:hypothetical protein
MRAENLILLGILRRTHITYFKSYLKSLFNHDGKQESKSLEKYREKPMNQNEYWY